MTWPQIAFLRNHTTTSTHIIYCILSLISSPLYVIKKRRQHQTIIALLKGNVEIPSSKNVERNHHKTNVDLKKTIVRLSKHFMVNLNSLSLSLWCDKLWKLVMVALFTLIQHFQISHFQDSHFKDKVRNLLNKKLACLNSVAGIPWATSTVQ